MYIKKKIILDNKEMEHNKLLEFTNKNSSVIIDDMSKRLSNKDDEIKNLTEKILILTKENGELDSKIKAKQESIEEMKKQLEEHFKNISNETIKTQIENFDQRQNKGLNVILEPLQKEIQAVKTQMENVSNNTTKAEIETKEYIKNLIEHTKDIANKADNFAEILKGEKKKQGTIGEWELENLLNSINMEEGIDYKKEVSETREDGTFRPDFVIHLTQGKNLIIDSKFSFNNYERYYNCENEADKQTYLKMYHNDVKNQIDNLSKKDYTKLADSCDFICVFLAVESAYLDLMKHDSSLIQYAFEKNIAIVTKSSLFSVLKMIINLRNIEKQNKNIEKIIDYAITIHDKLADFTTEVENIGTNLIKAKTNYDESIKKINGKGGVLSTAEKIKELAGKDKTQKVIANLLEN
jgi:DNA recombination protein RmuC